jgi:beta-galactosidase
LKDRLVPTADNGIEFTLKGPGIIIGVGNGDPASHEPEKYVETSDRMIISDLKYQLCDTFTGNNKTAENYDDSLWSKAFIKGYDEFEAGKNIILRGTFNLDDFTDKTIISLYAKSLVDNQSVYVNGILLGKGIKRYDPNQIFIPDNKSLHKGKNIVVFEGKPFVKKTEYEEINTDPGTIKVYNSAPQWKRKTFNGLAQIIVKTLKNKGVITLTASSTGLTTAVLKINSNVTIPRLTTEDIKK